MQMYGPTYLTAKVATKEDLPNLILCTQILPDISEVVEGTLMQLIKPQKGYAAGRFYLVKDGRWIDVANDFGPKDRSLSGSLKCEHEVVTDTGDTEYHTGYLLVSWDPVTENQSAGKLLYSTVVRKLDGFPVHPGDGIEIVRAPLGTGYTEDDPYRWFDMACSSGNEELLNRFKYRVFHIFKSGWWGYSL